MADETHGVCDMRGFLSFLILWIVRNQSMTGSEIADEIEKRKGCKPNPGTIYPALKELVRKKAIKLHVEGNKKTYSLTSTGREELNGAVNSFCKTFYDVVRK